MKRTGILITIICLALFTKAQNRYDVVIEEIMADPSPVVGLPNNEWIELKNISASSINLQNWRIGDAGSQSGALPNFLLQPDSLVMVCAAASVSSMTLFGAVISVTSFPSLDNESDVLYLKSSTGKTIHAVNYTDAWYKNELKKQGGWSLEMIDPHNPCSGMSNWTASMNINGGTPGRKNSVDAVNNDSDGPGLKNAYVTDSISIILVFDEPLDSAAAANSSSYSIDQGITVLNVTVLPSLFKEVKLKLLNPLNPALVYKITVQNLRDCKGNLVGSANSTLVGLPSDPFKGEWTINEILFNPRSNAFDYVEFYNNSKKIFDASKLSIANRNSNNIISSIKPLSISPFYIFPGDYIVETENADNLSLQYLVRNPDHVLTISSPPSFPDDKGTVIALNSQGTVVDEVNYKDYWHYKLIADAEGVALERMILSGNSNDPNNWHSAASTAGYGTPTYKNSQYKLLDPVKATIDVSPKIFSPDNDGRDDVATIQYKVEASGYLANITIFNVAGLPVRKLVQNQLLGLTGYWNWDGLDDKGLKLPIGNYILYSEVFNLQGQKEIFKNSIVLGRVLN